MTSYEMLMSLVLTVVYLASPAEANIDCPQIVDKPDNFSRKFSFKKYDTSKMKYYVMTPTSYPKFVNPDGEIVDWTKLGCLNKKILFNCHGWFGYGLDLRFVDIIRTFVRQYDGCAISCDYFDAANNYNWPLLVGETSCISKAMADFIQKNVCSMTDCTEQLQLHGHSWGAHTCGVAGYFLKQRGLEPLRMIASDAVGPIFDKLPLDQPSLHLSQESARTVINIKTSAYPGSDVPGWAHQTQYIGLCGSAQVQCPGKGESASEQCDHSASVYITKSTIDLNFPRIQLTQCSSCPYSTPESAPSPGQCCDVQDYLGWQSQGKPGIFVIKTVTECLNVTLPEL